MPGTYTTSNPYALAAVNHTDPQKRKVLQTFLINPDKVAKMLQADFNSSPTHSDKVLFVPSGCRLAYVEEPPDPAVMCSKRV